MVDGPLTVGFIQDEVQGLAKEVIDSILGNNPYEHGSVGQWTQAIVENTLSQLAKLNKPFKYIVTCVIMQKNGAGLHLASSCLWDSTTDGNVMLKWENKSMYCVCSVFGCSI